MLAHALGCLAMMDNEQVFRISGPHVCECYVLVFACLAEKGGVAIR